MSVPGGPSDADLVARVLAGDREAFAQVYDRYADRLHDFAHAMLRQPEEAADAVADSFVLMAEKLGQLRDPDRLRPWLYSVVRRECLRRLRGRNRVAYDGEDRLMAMSDDAQGPEREAEVAALRTLVWDAAAGLGDRDRALLDLHLRQGLEGAELAEAAGITPSNAYTSLNRLRAQVERSLGALLIARMGRDDCPELSSLLGAWDGRFSPLVRKRVARHVDDCDVCGHRRAKMVSPLALLAGVPLLPAPAALRDRVLDDARMVAALSSHEAAGTRGGLGGPSGGAGGRGGGAGGASEAVRRRRAAVAAGAGAAAVGVIAGLLLVLPDRGPTLTDAAAPAPSESTSASASAPPITAPPTPTQAPAPSTQAPTTPAPTTPGPTSAPPTTPPPRTPTAPAPAPAQLEVAERTITIPAYATSASTTVSNAGGRPLEYVVEVVSGAEWLSAIPLSGSLPGGGSGPLTANVDRRSMPTSSVTAPTTGQLLVSWGEGQPVEVTVVVAPEPLVEQEEPTGPVARQPADQQPAPQSNRQSTGQTDGQADGQADGQPADPATGPTTTTQP